MPSSAAREVAACVTLTRAPSSDTLVASLWLIAILRGAAPRFYPDDPLRVDNDRVIDVTTADKIDLDDGWQTVGLERGLDAK